MTDIPSPQPAPGKYRKKPIVIEAVQLPPDDGREHDCPGWFVGAVVGGRIKMIPGGGAEVRTLEDGADGRAKHVADVGDWIIKGVQGELYPCKPDIFAATYEPAAIPAPESAEPPPLPEWPCTCDERGIGMRGVSCGDCPRDYGHKVAHAEADRLLDEYMRACGSSDAEARDKARAAVRAALAQAQAQPKGTDACGSGAGCLHKDALIEHLREQIAQAPAAPAGQALQLKLQSIVDGATPNEGNLPKQDVCLDPGHNFPTHLHIPAGQGYRHVCPSCGKTTTVTSPVATF